MERKYATMEITYDVEKDKFDVKGDLNPDGQTEVLESFLRLQIGEGKDPNPMVEREQYHIKLQWFPDIDEIRSEYDTGNKGLRDGLLMELFRRTK